MVESVVQSHAEIVVDSTEKSKIRVLHVDDELALLKVAKQCLELQGPFQVDAASSVEEALAKLQKEHYDAVVSDYQMPGKDGLEFLEMLRKNGNTIPFIMFTGKGREEVAVRAWSLGADHYVNKTGDPETVYCELAHCLRSTVEKHFAEAQIKEKVQKLQTIYQNAVEGISYVDAEENIVYANKAFADIVGYEQDQLAGMNLHKIVDDKNWAKIENETNRRRQGESSRYEVDFRRSDGTVRNALISGAPFFDHDGRFAGTVGIVLDITEAKKNESESSDRQRRLQSLFDASPNAILVIDLNGKIVECNGRAQEIFGYSSRSEFVGRSALEPIAEEDRQRAMENMEKVLKQGLMRSIEYTIIANDGSRRALSVSASVLRDVSGNPIGFVSAIEDITERKKSEELLRESEERFRGLFESIQDPVGIFVGREGRLIDYNAAFKKSSGYTDEELKGKAFLDFVHPDDRAMVLEKYQTKYSEEELPLVYEIRGMNKKGESIPLELSVSTYKQKGKVIGIEVIHRDITERKKAEQTLKESEEKYRNLIELAPDGIVAVNAEGIVTSANRSFLRLVGYDSDEGIVGKSFTELKTIPVEDIPKFQEMLSSLMNGEPLSPVEFLYVRKDGTSQCAEVHPGLLIEDGKPVGVQVVMRDVSERKNAEKLNQENQQKFEQLFMSNPEAAVCVDPNERVLNVNPRFTELFGYSFDEVKEKFLDDFVVPEDRRKEALMLAQKGKEGYVYYETVRKNKKGSPIPVALSSAPIVLQGQHLGDIVLYKDITELKRAQEESEESRKHFQMLFDLMADPVTVVDERGKILEVTQKVEEITGFKKEELVGKSFLKVEMFGAKTKAVMIKSLAERMMGMHVQPYEVEVLKKDGGKLMYEINAAKIDYKGKPADLIVFRDILERKNLEEKLRVVGSLTRHDVRNKLSAVTGNVYLLRRKLAGNPEALEQLADMENAVRNVEAIFEFARTYEKLGVEQLVKMNVGKAVDEAASLFPDLKGIRIANECGGLTVLADSLLRQLFYNLIDDSLKYGEKLTQIRVRYEEFEDKLKLIYEDDGVGISRDAKSKLFTEGFTTGKGSGYGLYLIRRMMEVYGWTISETGTHGKGAQFTINIPKAKQDGR